MLGLLIAMLISAGLVPSEAPEEHLFVINSNISVGNCVGGSPIVVYPEMSERVFTGDFFGEAPSLQAFDAQCPGFYESDAQFCLSVPAPGGRYTVELIDAEGMDTTLAVVGSQQDWPRCDDDGGTRGHSLLSRVSEWFAAGDYLVYVGSYSQGVNASFTLAVSSE